MLPLFHILIMCDFDTVKIMVAVATGGCHRRSDLDGLFGVLFPHSKQIASHTIDRRTVNSYQVQLDLVIGPKFEKKCRSFLLQRHVMPCEVEIVDFKQPGRFPRNINGSHTRFACKRDRSDCQQTFATAVSFKQQAQFAIFTHNG